MSAGIRSISRYSEAFVSCYSSDKEWSNILEIVDDMDEFLQKNEDVSEVLLDRFVAKELKHSVIDEMMKAYNEILLSNFLHILVDKGLIYHLHLFFKTIRGRLQEKLFIKNVYVFSSFDISADRRVKMEKLWKERVPAKHHNFFYSLDKSLKLGVKVQVDSLVDEFSIASNLLMMKLKFDAIAL